MIEHRRWHWAAVIATLVLLALAGVAFGSVHVGPRDLFATLRGGGDSVTRAIVVSLRGPRVLLAALVGAALGVSGGALQGTLRNLLAEPYLLGVSGGAAVGAVLAVAAGAQSPAIPIAAFAGGVAAVVVALIVARAGGSAHADPRALLMAGVVIGAFANAVIMVSLANAPADDVRGALWWMMGSAGNATWAGVAWLAVYVLTGCATLFVLAPEMDVLTLGDDAAAALGVNVGSASRRIFLVSALLAAATVAAAGLIGFVGLIVPHIVRAAGIRAHRPLLVGAALVGALLLVAADLAARTLLPPVELPLGAITALLGVPFFLAQLRRQG